MCSSPPCIHLILKAHHTTYQIYVSQFHMWIVNVDYNESNDTQSALASSSQMPFTLPQEYLLPNSKYGIGRNRTTNFIMLDSVHVSRDQIEIETDPKADSNSLNIIVKSRAKTTVNEKVYLLSSAEAKSNRYKSIKYAEDEITIKINRFTIVLRWLPTLKIRCSSDFNRGSLTSHIPVIFSTLDEADVCITNSLLEILQCFSNGVGVFLDPPPTEWLQHIKNHDDLTWYNAYEKYLRYPKTDRSLFLSTIKCIVNDTEVSKSLSALGGTIVPRISDLMKGDTFITVGEESEVGVEYPPTLLDRICKAVGACDLTLLHIHKMIVKKANGKRSNEDEEEHDIKDEVTPSLGFSSRRKRRKYARIDQLEFLDFTQVPEDSQTNEKQNDLVQLETKNSAPSIDNVKSEKPVDNTKQLQTASPDSVSNDIIHKSKELDTEAIESKTNRTDVELLPPPRLPKRRLSNSETSENPAKKLHPITLVDAIKQAKLQGVRHIKLELGMDDEFQDKKPISGSLAIVQTIDVQLRQKPMQTKKAIESSNDKRNFKRFVKNKIHTPVVSRKYVDMNPVTVSHGYQLVNPQNMVERIDYEEHLQKDFEGLIDDLRDVNVSNNATHIELETLFVPESQSLEENQVDHSTHSNSHIVKSNQQKHTNDDDDDDDDDEDDGSQPRFAFRQT